VARNPPWVEDELLVVLELYLAERRVLGEDDPRVVEASRLLNRLPIHTEAGQPTFRTPDAVVLRLANFRSYDPTTTAKGMTNAGRLAEATWQRYANDPGTVRDLVGAIRAIADSPRTRDAHDPAPPTGDAAPEGILIYRRHRLRERDPHLRARKLRHVREAGERPSCEVCGLIPELVFGQSGASVLECHHLTPLRLGERTTRLTDIALVCANCHRALHGSGLLTTPDQLRAKLPASFVAGTGRVA
jgi:5-methylcytosine-specific restriction protein A